MSFRDKQLTEKEKAGILRAAEAVKQINGGKRQRVFVRTFGCQQNEADSEKILGMAVNMGYVPTEDADIADLIVINTCAVREHAEKKALSVIGQYKHCKRRKPELVIAVCGCMVSQLHRTDELKNKYPYVDFTFGTSDIHLFPQLLEERLKGGKRSFTLPPDEPAVAENIPIHRLSSYRAWVSIMYGCNNFCSYCIVPYVRGRERSRCPEEVIKEVRGLVEAGYKEITLLGQNVNSYGRDCSFDCNFSELLRRLDKIDGEWILRFMTSHPKDASFELIDVIAGSKHIAHQFHLPAQSGSDPVLKKMNRVYTREKYMEIMNYIKAKMPDCVITTDIIVGFPGETDEDFEKTLDLLSSVRYDMVFSFIYSPRKGTPAASMEQVPEEVKGVRMKKLLDLQTEIASELSAPYGGRRLRVLCCGRSQTDEGMLEGRTEGNKTVLFEGDASLEGRFVDVEVTQAGAFVLRGKLI